MLVYGAAPAPRLPVCTIAAPHTPKRTTFVPGEAQRVGDLLPTSLSFLEDRGFYMCGMAQFHHLAWAISHTPSIRPQNGPAQRPWTVGLGPGAAFGARSRLCCGSAKKTNRTDATQIARDQARQRPHAACVGPARGLRAASLTRARARPTLRTCPGPRPQPLLLRPLRARVRVLGPRLTRGPRTRTPGSTRTRTRPGPRRGRSSTRTGPGPRTRLRRGSRSRARSERCPSAGRWSGARAVRRALRLWAGRCDRRPRPRRRRRPGGRCETRCAGSA